MYLIPQAWQSPSSALPAAGIACHLSLGLLCLSRKARSRRTQKVCSLVLSHQALLVASLPSPVLGPAACLRELM